MGPDAPRSETTLAIIVGASKFPKHPELTDAKAFENAAKAFKAYLLDATGLALPPGNVLDVFDDKRAGAEVDEAIAKWLELRRTELKAQGRGLRDLIFYYVGHGGFSAPGNQFFLALRSTRVRNEGMSSYAMSALANTLREHVAHARRYLIIDSCFSAAAQASFMSAPLEVAKQQTLDEFPGKGTALLCAAGPKDPAKTLPGQKYTMFSGALLDILNKGLQVRAEKLSLEDIGEAARVLIKERYPDKAVRPELHSPDQSQGDLVRLPLFPNRAWRAVSKPPAHRTKASMAFYLPFLVITFFIFGSILLPPAPTEEEPVEGQQKDAGELVVPSVPTNSLELRGELPPPPKLFSDSKVALKVPANKIWEIKASDIKNGEAKYDTIEIEKGGKLLLPSTPMKLTVRKLVVQDGTIQAGQSSKILERQWTPSEIRVWDATQVDKLKVVVNGRDGASYQKGKTALPGADGRDAGWRDSTRGAAGANGKPGGRGQDALNLNLHLGMLPLTAKLEVFANGGTGGRGQDGGPGGQGGDGNWTHGPAHGGDGGASGPGGGGGNGGNVKILLLYPKPDPNLGAYWQKRIAWQAARGAGGGQGLPGEGKPQGIQSKAVPKMNESDSEPGSRGQLTRDGKSGASGTVSIGVNSFESYPLSPK